MTVREAYRQIFSPLAERRMHNGECPNCGKPKSEWDRRTNWRCCSTKCTKEFWDEHDKSWSWSQFRYGVFKRDNWSCQKCGKRETYDMNLIADHIKPLAMDGKMWDMNNLQTLCRNCNKKKTKQDLKDIANFKKGKLKIRTEQLMLG